jgi:hypothetical protein
MALDRDPIDVPARTRVHDGSHGSNVLIQVEVAVHLDIDVGEGRIDGCIYSTIPDLFQYRSERRVNKGDELVSTWAFLSGSLERRRVVRL